MQRIDALATDRDTLAGQLRDITVEIWSGNGHGAGVRWPVEGLIATCSHVVSGSKAMVRFGDGSESQARLLLDEPQSDIAFLLLDNPPAKSAAATIRREPLRAGEILFAMGNPWGEARVLTSGVAMGPAGDPRLVAADLRVLPGNSGGPLVDARGRLAGIVSMYRGGSALAIAAVEADRLVARLDGHPGATDAEPGSPAPAGSAPSVRVRRRWRR